MADIFHPATGHLVRVPDTAVPTYRRGGWVLLSEWKEQQEAGVPQPAATIVFGDGRPASLLRTVEFDTSDETPNGNGNGTAKGTGAEPGKVAKVEEKI